MKNLSESEIAFLLRENKRLEDGLRCVQIERNRLFDDIRGYDIENKALSNSVKRITKQRDDDYKKVQELKIENEQLLGNINYLKNCLERVRKKREDEHAEISRLHRIIRDFSESALEVLDGH